MANQVYENFYLSNEVEDQFNSHLDLAQFCTIDRNLEGTAGMKRIINVYSATDGTEKLAKGAGNSKSISVSFEPKEYEILLAQNRFDYYDEEAMTDPNIVPVGMKHAGTDLFNTANADIYAEYAKATLETAPSAFDFAAFVDAQAKLGLENIEDVQMFGFVCPDDMAAIRKALKDDLKYVEAFAKNGYVGSVAGINLYTKADATAGTVIIGTKDAVTLFVKTGVETEQERDGNARKNSIFNRKYYLAALTDATKAVKMVKA
jgi:hypothetical protein